MTLYKFDGRWIGAHGIGRFALEVSRRIKFVGLGCGGSPANPFDSVRLDLYLVGRKFWLVSPGYNAPLLTVARSVITIHDLNHLETKVGWLKSLYYNTLLKRACLRAARVLTVSEYSRRRILDWSGVADHRVVNVGNGVSEIFSTEGARFELGVPYLLCIGNRKPHKNEKRVVEAFAMAKLDPRVQLVFNGDVSEELAAAIRLSGVTDRVHFLGRLDEPTLASVYRGATALVFPSLYEGFGFPVVEAMACGVPVLTSNVTSLPEVGGDAVLYVDPIRVQAIARGIERLMGDVELRSRLIEAGLQRVKQYSWDSVAQKVQAVLDEVAKC